MGLFHSVVHGGKQMPSALSSSTGFPSQLEIIFIRIYLLYPNASIPHRAKDSPMLSADLRDTDETIVHSVTFMTIYSIWRNGISSIVSRFILGY